jgi:hypothetical protein
MRPAPRAGCLLACALALGACGDEPRSAASELTGFVRRHGLGDEAAPALRRLGVAAERSPPTDLDEILEGPVSVARAVRRRPAPLLSPAAATWISVDLIPQPTGCVLGFEERGSGIRVASGPGPYPHLRFSVGRIPDSFLLDGVLTVRGAQQFNAEASFYLTPGLPSDRSSQVPSERLLEFQIYKAGGSGNLIHGVGVLSRGRLLVTTPKGCGWLPDRPTQLSILFDRDARAITARLWDQLRNSVEFLAGPVPLGGTGLPHPEVEWVFGHVPPGADRPTMHLEISELSLRIP